MKKYIIYGIVAIIIIGGLYIWNTKTSYSPSEDELINTPIATSTTTYTLAQVKEHTDGNSCYSAINGNVYDLTSWIDKHPGGKIKILLICGKDGSTLFNLQHGDKTKPNNKLATFKIGTLTQ